MPDPVLEFLGSLSRQHKHQLSQSSDRAYRWDRLDPRTKHFQPALMSGDAEMYGSTIMQGRVRNEVLNNAQVKNVVTRLVDLIVGTGLQTFSNPFDAVVDLDSDMQAEFQYALESDSWFEDWANDPKQCDVEGKRTWFDMQALGLRECVQAGNFLLLRCQRNEPGRMVPLCFQLLEFEQLDASKDRPQGPRQNKIVNGIEVDRFGRPVAYHVYDAHPHDNFTPFSSSEKSTRIPSDRITHLYAFNRPSMSFGVNWLTAMGQTAFDRDKFVSSEIATAAKAALMAMIHKSSDGGGAGAIGLADEDGTSVDAYGNEEVVLGTSPVAVSIGLDEDVQVVESNRPNPNAGPFLDILDHDGAGAVGLSHVRYTGRYEKTSYTAARAAHLDDEAHVRPIQNWLGYGAVIPVRREFNAQAASSGLFQTITPSEFRRDQKRLQRFKVIGPGREQLDPEAETEAASGRIRSAQSTLEIENGRRGLHWVRVLIQRSIENRLASQLGVVLDHSKGQGGQVDSTTTEETADAES